MILPPEYVDTLARAAVILRQHAEALRECSTVPESDDDWYGDDAAAAQYSQEVSTARDVELAAAEYAHLYAERRALIDTLTALVEERQPLGIDRATYQNALHLLIKIEGDEVI